MKRRQASPARALQHKRILPEVIQDEYDKLDKTNQLSFTSIKRALPWRRALLLSVSFFVCLVHFTRFIHSDDTRRPITVKMMENGNVYRLVLTNHPDYKRGRQNLYWIHNGAHYHDPPYEEEEEEANDKCVPMGDWQTERNIFACNDFHQVDLTSPTLFNIGGGSYRDAWAMREYDGTYQVIKTLAWDRHLDWDDWESARREAMAMAQTSSSHYVANIYGACSHSTIMDYSPDGILWWLFDDFDPTKEELLQIAHDVAQGVADAQNPDEQGRPTICHMDVKANQFILINGTYKINDFNMCEFLKWDPEEDRYCSFEGGYVGRWQAPEHIGTQIMLEDAKSDVFSLGYVLYFLLTGDQQWHSDSSGLAAKWAYRGKRPEIPQEALNSTHPFDYAVVRAIKWCLRQQPKDRPSAQEIADYLLNALVNAGLKDEPLKIIEERDAEEREEEEGQDDQVDNAINDNAEENGDDQSNNSKNAGDDRGDGNDDQAQGDNEEKEDEPGKE